MIEEVKFYWRLALHRMPIMLALVILCSTAGIIQALRLPPTYETNARLLIEGRQISEDLVDAVVEVAADEEIQIIRERLLTRANLLDIADDFEVLENRAEMTPDKIVEHMMENTSIQSTGGRNEATLITVRFAARSGQIAADVVNEYVTRIMDASVALRDDRSGGTRQFFEQQVARLSADLDARSAQITQFQTENADALPGDQNFRLSRQTVLRERIAGGQRELTSLIDQRSRIIEIYEQTGQIDNSDAMLNEDQRQLRDLERELSQMLAIYSERAPQVVAMQQRVDQLRRQITNSIGTDVAINPRQALLDLQLEEIDTQVATIETVINEANAELSQLESAIARTPLNAVTLESLERDYERVQSQYDNAVERLNQASTADDINVSELGQRITLIEPANVPVFPARPNRKLIAFIGGVAGLSLAAAFFAVMEVLNRKVRRGAEIVRPLGIEPLTIVPYIETRRERTVRIMGRAAALLLVLVVLPGGLFALDSVYPLDQLAGEIMSRLGRS